MNFDNLAHWLIAILWIVSIIGVYLFTRRRGEGEGLIDETFSHRIKTWIAPFRLS